MAQISLAWCMAKDGVSAPIIGTTSLENLEDLLGKLLHCQNALGDSGLMRHLNVQGSLDVKLTDEEMKYLEEPYKPVKIAGHS